MRRFKLNKIRIASLEKNQLFGRGIETENTTPCDPKAEATIDTCQSIHLQSCHYRDMECTNTSIGGHDPTNPGTSANTTV